MVLIAVLEPVFTALGGWWVGEIIMPRIVTSGALILVGMLLAEFEYLLRSRR